MHFLTDEGLLDAGTCRFRSMVIPDLWIETGSQKEQYDIAALNEPQIYDRVEGLLLAVKDKKAREGAAHLGAAGAATGAGSGSGSAAADGARVKVAASLSERGPPTSAL